jgi:hypothetical protein
MLSRLRTTCVPPAMNELDNRRMRDDQLKSASNRVDALDLSLFEAIRTGGTSDEDRRSLLALHSAIGRRGGFAYLEIGSYLGGSLQAFLVDPRCRAVTAVDRRDEVSPDERNEPVAYPDNTTENMLHRLAGVPEAELGKLTTVDASTEDLDPNDYAADVCFIDGEHTNAAALRDARFSRAVLRDHGVLVFHDRTLVARGIRAFLRELPRGCRLYPLKHDLLVVEIGIPSLVTDPSVRRQVPRRIWLAADRLRAVPWALRLTERAQRPPA